MATSLSRPTMGSRSSPFTGSKNSLLLPASTQPPRSPKEFCCNIASTSYSSYSPKKSQHSIHLPGHVGKGKVLAAYSQCSLGQAARFADRWSGICRASAASGMQVGGASESENPPAAEANTEDAPGLVEKMERTLYKWPMDILPAVIGRLNPLSGFLLYFTGAVAAEAVASKSENVIIMWLVVVLLPALVSMTALKYWLYKRRLTKAGELEPGTDSWDTRKAFLKTQRGAWIDVHLSLQVLVPAGMSGQLGADWYLLLVPVTMLIRFFGARKWRPVAMVAFWIRRIFTILLGLPALALLVTFAVRPIAEATMSALTFDISSLLFFPISLGLTYLVQGAPAVLIPGAMKAAWQGRDRPGGPKVLPVMTESERKAAKKEKMAWIAAWIVAMGVTFATGKDWLVWVLMVMQWLKTSPSKLLDIMINKGHLNKGMHWSDKLEDRIEDRKSWIYRWRQRTEQGTLHDPPPPAEEDPREVLTSKAQDAKAWFTDLRQKVKAALPGGQSSNGTESDTSASSSSSTTHPKTS